MSLDPILNFAKGEVSIGYDDTATSIVLSSGDGANFPSSFSYNVVWWNFTDFPDPSDDPNVEIVRVTARTSDTLTVTRAQEGTAATTKNTGGKTYKMILAFTKKTYDEIAPLASPVFTISSGNNFIIGTDKFVVRGSDGKIGIGTADPTVTNKDTVNPTVVISGNGVAGSFQIIRHTSVGGGGALQNLSSTRGADTDSHTILQSGDGMGTFSFKGSDGVQYITGANIVASVDGTPGVDDMPTRLVIFTTPQGGSTALERMRITNSGDVGIDTIVPLARLHVSQLSAIGAKPVLALDQLDISEEMIEFNTTIGVGNAIEAIASKVLTTTHFIKITIPGGLTRYIPCGTIA